MSVISALHHPVKMPQKTVQSACALEFRGIIIVLRILHKGAEICTFLLAIAVKLHYGNKIGRVIN